MDPCTVCVAQVLVRQLIAPAASAAIAAAAAAHAPSAAAPALQGDVRDLQLAGDGQAVETDEENDLDLDGDLDDISEVDGDALVSPTAAAPPAS